MMSVPAINSLPPSGNQTTKMNSSPTANPSVSPIGLSVSPKLSVIPSSQIPAAQTKSPTTGVNHSSVPLSLVFENKVSSSQQPQQSMTKSPSDKPKDLSPAKPTSNGVEGACIKSSPQNTMAQTAQPAPASQPTQTAQAIQSPPTTPAVNSKQDESPAQLQANTNHTEKKVPTAEGTNELPAPKEENVQKSAVPPPTNNMTTDEKIEQNTEQNPAKQAEEKTESKGKKEATEAVVPQKEEPGTDPKPQETPSAASKSPASSQPSKRKREPKVPEKKNNESEPDPEKKPRRIRSQVLPYQSPLPELATFISKSLKEKDATQKNNEEKLIVFYKNEFLAVRNAEGGFYLCQTLQNVYRSSHRIRIRWLSQDKEKSNEEGDIYTPDFYDLTDFECILTTVALNKTDKNMYKLQKVELERIENILKRALDVEKGVTEKPSITEEHPDGIDLSLYKDESQLQKPKKASKRAASSPSRKATKQAKKDESDETEKTPKRAIVKGKRRNVRRPIKKTAKATGEKSKVKKRGGGKVDSKSSKAVDQLKVSPPNEKARVVAKVLRKVDIVPAKESVSKKQAKSKVEKRSQEMLKNQKKKPLKNGAKKSTFKEESSSSHTEKKQAKTKHTNNKNKKN